MEKSNEREDYLPWLVPCPFKKKKEEKNMTRSNNQSNSYPLANVQRSSIVFVSVFVFDRSISCI